MKKIIHHLRRQSEEVRRHILHLLVIVGGIILLLLWIYSLGTTFSNTDGEAKSEKESGTLSVLKDNLVGGYQSISQPDLKTEENSL